MARITKIEKGRTVGRGRLEREEVKRIFDFCRTFDISRATNPEAEYVFDVRPEAIHWLDKETRAICASLYCSTGRGDVKIEMGDFEDWNREIVLEKWNTLIEVALRAAF